MLSWSWPCSKSPHDDKNFSGKQEDIPRIKAPKATVFTNRPVSGNEVEMPMLENRAIRISKKQLHKQEDFFGAVLSKDEGEKRGARGKKITHCCCCQIQLHLQGPCWQVCADAHVLLSLNLHRNTGRLLCQSREMPAPDPWIKTPTPHPHTR